MQINVSSSVLIQLINYVEETFCCLSEIDKYGVVFWKWILLNLYKIIIMKYNKF